MTEDVRSLDIITDLLRVSGENLSIHELIQFFSEKYGEYLHKLLLKEWEIIQKEEMLAEWENEHGQSLALLMTNEAQKIQLEELNEKLATEIQLRKVQEARLLELKKQLEEKNRELERLSMLDGLTGIPNRRNLDKKIAEEWYRSIRNGFPISLAIVDIDFFKLYNDTYGHIEGDDCLRQIANILFRALKRAGDFVARYGGEEFVILLPQTPLNEAMKTAQYLRSMIEEANIPHMSSPIKKNVTVSMGLACMVPKKADNYLTLIQAADLALYKSKKEGRDQVRIYSEQLNGNENV